MGFFNWIKKELSPKQRVAALVAAVVDALNEQFEIEGEAWLEGDRMKFRISIVDKPEKKQDLDAVAR